MNHMYLLVESRTAEGEEASQGSFSGEGWLGIHWAAGTVGVKAVL